MSQSRNLKPPKSVTIAGRAKRIKGDLKGALEDYNKAIELRSDFARGLQ